MKQTIILFAACLLATGCSTTRIANYWVKPDTDHPALNKIIVMALVTDNNPSLQQKVEQEVATEIRNRGYNATSYYDEYGGRGVDKNDQQGTITKIRNKGADAILTVALLDTAKERHYQDGKVDYYPSGSYYNKFPEYYSNVYDRLYTTSYYTTNTRYLWEANLYNAASQDMLYSVQTEYFDPAATAELAEHYGHVIVANMIKNGILYRKKK